MVKQSSENNESTLAKLTEAPENSTSTGLLSRLRNYFLTGLIVVGPMLITLYSAWLFVDFIDSWVQPYIPEKYMPGTYIQYIFSQLFSINLPEFNIPGIGLLFAIVFIMMIGALTANLFGRTLFGYGEHLLNRMPVIRNIYNALKQIFETILTSSGSSFQKVGLIEYPRKGIYSIVFVSKETAGEIGSYQDEIGDELLSVFLPTTPNPTSGYLLFVPKNDIRILDMSVEEAAKMVISAGLVEPGVEETGTNTENGISKDKASNIPNNISLADKVINQDKTANQQETRIQN